MIIIDNYDSFTYNIVQYCKMAGASPLVFKNDEISVSKLKTLDFSSIIISPGAKNPDLAGISLDVIKEFYKTKKILGICLGHQCVAQFFGAKIVKDTEPTHGKNSTIVLDLNSKIFKGLKKEISATRYHSLMVLADSIKPPLKITAKTKNGIVMAVEHNMLPIYGLQFHPEAVLSEFGFEMIENFIKI